MGEKLGFDRNIYSEFTGRGWFERGLGALSGATCQAQVGDDSVRDQLSL